MSIKIYKKNNFVVVDADGSSIKYLASHKADFDDVEDSGFVVWNVDNSKEVYSFMASELQDESGAFVGDKAAVLEYLTFNINFKTGNVYSESITSADIDTLSHFIYNPVTDKLEADRAIETTLNSLFLGEQHKMSSGAENIFFTNLGNSTNFYPMWGGLKDQSVTANQGSDGYIAPSGRVYTDMFSLPLGGNPDPLTSIGYTGGNYFAVSIAGLGITTTIAEDVEVGISLEYKLSVNNVQVYKQILPTDTKRFAGDVIEWFFDHPVEIHAGTTIFAEIIKIDRQTDIEYGVLQVRMGDDGTSRYQAVVHNRLFEDKDLELISPYLKYKAMDFGLDSTGSTILLKDLSLGADNLLVPHAVNTLEAIANGTEIQIKIKGGAKIIVESLPVNAVSINGAFVNSVLNQAIVQLNAIFTNTAGFASDDTFVDSFTLSGNDLILGLNDGVSYTVDVTTLGVDENNFVVSGSLSGSDLNLTMDDATVITVDASGLAIDTDVTVTSGTISGTDLILTLSDSTTVTIDASTLGGSGSSGNPVVSGSVIGTNLVLVLDDASTITIDATNMINGSSGLSNSSGWFISYGANANNSVGTSTNDSTVNQQLPFYFGESFTRGSEFKFNFQNHGGSNLILGIWDGAEVAIAYNNGANTASNWGTNFTYAGGFIAGSNSTLTNTTNGSKYVVTNGDVIGMRFLNDGHLVLMDLTGGGEVEIARTTIALSVTSFNIQMYTWANGILPNGIISNSDFLWDIKHDYSNTEAGLFNGVLTHTVLERQLSLSPGEKYMIPLDKQGAGETFGIGYTGATTGVVTAEDDLLTSFKYQTNESIIGDVNWSHNTSASGYFTAGGGSIDSYRVGGAGTEMGLVSLRYTYYFILELWSETNNELIATTVVHPDGSDINLFFGVNGNTNYSDLPSITKQLIGQGSQPLENFVPTVANQTTSVTEGDVLNFQIISSDNIVNQFIEVDAPSWMSLNQSSGILSGTAPYFLGTSADTIVVNCKAGNAVGGTVDFTVTVGVTEIAYTNNKSLNFPTGNTTAYLQGNHQNVSALRRTGNGSGASDAWSISMWVKPSTSTTNQTFFYYGGDDLANEGRITLTQFQGNNLLFSYGSTSNYIAHIGVGNFPTNQWNHVLITYDGGLTGSASADISNYITAFTMSINGVNGSSQAAHGNYGWSSNIIADKFRIGRLIGATTSAYVNGGSVNQVAIWDTDESANLSTIYNSGSTQDLSLLSSAPSHYYEIETSVTTVSDIIGSADLTGFNLSASDLVSDTP